MSDVNKSWMDPRGFDCWIKEMNSTFGRYAWGQTSHKTGKGGGAFSATIEEAERAIEAAIQEQLTELSNALTDADMQLLAELAAAPDGLCYNPMKSTIERVQLMVQAGLMTCEEPQPKPGAAWLEKWLLHKITPAGRNRVEPWARRMSENGTKVGSSDDDLWIMRQPGQREIGDRVKIVASTKELPAELIGKEGELIGFGPLYSTMAGTNSVLLDDGSTVTIITRHLRVIKPIAYIRLEIERDGLAGKVRIMQADYDRMVRQLKALAALEGTNDPAEMAERADILRQYE